uniref:H2A Barr body-deficient n=1 Tax=Canis lupus familiaris TaxID=9615 RepID=A0A8C0NZI5_CANLF
TCPIAESRPGDRQAAPPPGSSPAPPCAARVQGPPGGAPRGRAPPGPGAPAALPPRRPAAAGTAGRRSGPGGATGPARGGRGGGGDQLGGRLQPGLGSAALGARGEPAGSTGARVSGLHLPELPVPRAPPCPSLHTGDSDPQVPGAAAQPARGLARPHREEQARARASGAARREQGAGSARCPDSGCRPAVGPPIPRPEGPRATFAAAAAAHVRPQVPLAARGGAQWGRVPLDGRAGRSPLPRGAYSCSLGGTDPDSCPLAEGPPTPVPWGRDPDSCPLGEGPQLLIPWWRDPRFLIPRGEGPRLLSLGGGTPLPDRSGGGTPIPAPLGGGTRVPAPSENSPPENTVPRERGRRTRPPTGPRVAPAAGVQRTPSGRDRRPRSGRSPGAGRGAGGSERAAAGPSVRGAAACAAERADMSGVHVGARELLHARGWRPMPSARRRASDFPPFLAGEGRANEDAVTSSDLRVTACAAGRGGGVAFIRSGASSPAAQSSGAAGPARRTAVHPGAPLCAPTPSFGSAARGWSLHSPRLVSPQPEVRLSAARARGPSLRSLRSVSAARGRTFCSPRPVSPQPEPEAGVSLSAARCLCSPSPMSPRPDARASAARGLRSPRPVAPRPDARASAARGLRSPRPVAPRTRRPSVRSPGSPQPEARGSAARRPSVPSRAAAGPQPEAPRRAPPRPRARLRGSRGGRAGRPRSCRSRSARAGLAFSVCQMERLLRAGRYAKRLGASAPIFLAAVIQFLTATVLGLAGDEARHRRTAYITPELVDRALHNHELLSGLFTMTTVSQVAPARY